MILETSFFSVSYGRIEALKDANIHIDEHEAIAVIGANGAGKSSLLFGLSGIVESKGLIRYKGNDISSLPSHERVKLGLTLCPENRRIFPSLTTEQNLKLGAFRSKFKKSQLEFVYELFPVLYERKKQIAGYLSGGEQQMLAIGRAMMANPALLMLDEPSLGLAPILVDQVFKALEDLKKTGLSVLLVEQNAYKALSFADRAYILETGKVILEGNAKQLLSNDRVRSAYLGI